MAKKLLTKKKKKQLFSALLSIFIAFVAWIAQAQNWTNTQPDINNVTPAPSQTGWSNVLSIEDGDTITVDVDGQSEKVRLVGVDTPETRDPRTSVQCFGRAASEFTKSLIGSNQIRLETDKLSDNRDRYDRLLRYVYLPDNKLLNAELIRQGYGFAYTVFPFDKMEEFRQLEKQARESELGLWGSCTINQDKDRKTTNSEN